MPEPSNKYQDALNVFFRMSKDDTRLTAVHISLYFALFRYWLRNDGINPIVVNRRSLMACSKIKSTATYTHCIYDLQNFGYLTYQPSYHPSIGSVVSLHISKFISI
jgi:hypothetical protein